MRDAVERLMLLSGYVTRCVLYYCGMRSYRFTTSEIFQSIQELRGF